MRRHGLCACAVALLAAAPAAAQDVFYPGDMRDEWYYRQPPPSLPQQLSGIVRPLPPDRRPRRIERIRDVFVLMGACWRVPPQLGDSGQQITLRMSFTRYGDVMGKPMITYRKLGTNSDMREAFVNSIRDALRLCTPLPLSESLGAAIAGRPFTFRFLDAPPHLSKG